MLSHIQETLQKWQEAERMEHAFRRWAAFFYPLMNDADAAEALCAAGMRLVRREFPPGAAARSEVERIMSQRAKASVDQDQGNKA
jgi:hypothetical protein